MDIYHWFWYSDVKVDTKSVPILIIRFCVFFHVFFHFIFNIPWPCMSVYELTDSQSNALETELIWFRLRKVLMLKMMLRKLRKALSIALRQSTAEQQLDNYIFTAWKQIGIVWLQLGVSFVLIACRYCLHWWIFPTLGSVVPSAMFLTLP